jgi:hypothetical protein
MRAICRDETADDTGPPRAVTRVRENFHEVAACVKRARKTRTQSDFARAVRGADTIRAFPDHGAAANGAGATS